MADEELRLRVSVDDQASAQLIKLKSAMQEISGGANAAAMERMARQSQELGRHLRPIAEEAHRTTGAVNLLSRGLTSLAGAIASGFAIDKIKQFSDSMLELKSVSLQTGFGIGQIKAAVDGLEQSGIARGTTIANIKSLSEALYNLGQQGSTLRQQLMVHARTDPQAMASLLQRLTGFANVGDLRGAVNAVFEAYTNVVANEYNRTHSEFQARMKGKSFLEELKLSPEVVLATQQAYKSLSDEQIAALGRQLKAAEDFNREWVKTRQFVDEVTAGIQVPLAKAMAEFNEQIRGSGEAWGDSIGKEIVKFASDVAKATADIKQIIDFLSAPTWDKLKGLGGLFGGGSAIDLSLKPGGFLGRGMHDFRGAGEGIPPIGDLLKGKGGALVPGAPGNMAVPLLSGGTGWRGMPMSTNIEDRRGEEEQANWLKQNTEELRRLNDFLAPVAGGAPGGALGFLGTQAGGLAEGLGEGTGTARPLGGPMGGLPGMGGGPPSGTPGTGSGTPSGTPGTGTGGTPGTPSAAPRWPVPGAGNVIPSGFGQGAGLAGGWMSTAFPGAGGAWGGKPVATPPGWGGTTAPGAPGVADGRVEGGRLPTAAELADKSRPAGERFNNPFNMWFDKYAAQQGGINPKLQITPYDAPAAFPSGTAGAAAAIRKMAQSPLYSGKTMNALIGQWVGHGESYAGRIEEATGIPRNTVITPEFLKTDKGLLFLKTMARYETQWSNKARPGGLTDEQWTAARDAAFRQDRAATPGALQAGAPQAGDGGSYMPGEQKIGVSPTKGTVEEVMRGVDPSLIAAMRAGSAALPEGYTLEPKSGFRGGTKQSFHGRAMASDWMIRGPDGKLLPDEGDNPEAVEMHGRVARAAYGYLLKNDPKNARRFEWGGAFGTKLGGGGVPDLMHYDFGGHRGRMRPGRQVTAMGPMFRGAAASTASGGVPYLSQQQELDRTTGRELDKTPSVNVNGSGKISVEVKAPAGTKASANGDGLFKKTEINRQTQMEPAKSSTSSDATGGGQIESPA